MDAFSGADRRRRNLQVVLFLIILATLPFYAAGIFLLLTAPSQSAIPTPRATTPAALTRVLATNTRISLPTTSGGLAPTPGQFIPPVGIPTSNIIFPTANLPTATFFIFPTDTLAPTLTPFPTNPPPQPTNTQPPAPTATALPLPPTETPSPFPDTDGDGVPDNLDLCPGVVGAPPDGCPPPTP
jgi:eukaryotic-like serine/threonine-protein kinase